MRNKFMFVIGIASAGLSISAHADEGIKAFVIEALHAKGAPVTGVLGGQIANYFRSQTHSMQPIQIEAQMIKPMQPEGCGRVQIKFKQEVTAMAQKTIEFPMEINYCVDGSVPLNITDSKELSK